MFNNEELMDLVLLSPFLNPITLPILLLAMLREGPKRLVRLALSVGVLMPLIYLWYLANISRFTIDSEHFITLGTSVGGNLTHVSANDGLRMVIFGGGDIATPNLPASIWHSQGHGWTEVMCHKLGCDTHISFVPKTGDLSGAVVSNSLLDAAYRHVSTPTADSTIHNNTIELDYSWVKEQYQKPHQPDLATQVDSFLSSSQTYRAAAETLWVFNVGYWDVWYLAALPRRLATQVVDSSVRDLFFQIERLYQAAQDRKSVAFSEYSSIPKASNATESGNGDDRAARVPFRIFLTRVFDISLTPGFATARPKPPHPHSSASQLRNAAFLTNYWNALLEAAVDDWLTTPDPEYWSTTDTIDTQVVKALVNEKPLPLDAPYQKHYHGLDKSEHEGMVTFPYREFASYGIARYLRELMIDHQLRNADLSDHKGMGARPPEEGFQDITMPCAFARSDDGGVQYGEATGAKGRTVVCAEPDDYLFYTAFTVGQRAIREIGLRAARRFLDQVEDSSMWREKARVHKGRGRHGRKQKTTKWTA
ncbi:hypothetical protein F4859DRAFT_528572 [Xylaria cf. heliscus]|nr:hypothetical protein F4859DRAFT_528572 [Xylaria cf. heliscus]